MSSIRPALRHRCRRSRCALGTTSRCRGQRSSIRARGLLVAAVALIASIATTSAYAATDSLSAIGDTWLDQNDQTTNHGTSTTVLVKGRASQKRRTLIQFDLASSPACVAGVSGGTQTAAAAVPVSAAFVDWDVSSDVATFLSNPATNYGWIVKDSVEGSGDGCSYDCKFEEQVCIVGTEPTVSPAAKVVAFASPCD